VTASATATMDLRHGMATGFYRMVREWESEIEPQPGRGTHGEGTVSSEPRGWLTEFPRTTGVLRTLFQRDRIFGRDRTSSTYQPCDSLSPLLYLILILTFTEIEFSVGTHANQEVPANKPTFALATCRLHRVE